MLDFRKLTLEHIDRIKPFFAENHCRICDCTVGGTFMWRDFFQTEFAIEDDVLFLKVRYFDGRIAFTPPIGDDSIATYQKIISYCEANDLPVVLCTVTARRLMEIRTKFPCVRTRSERSWFDYLYKSVDIATLQGKKFSGQRNHINRFIRTYPDWSFEKIGQTNIPEVRAFFVRYSSDHQKDFGTFEEERIKILEVLDHFECYGLIGGVLKVGGKVIAFSIGERGYDTMFIHVEKADREYQGSYQMLVNQFARTFVDEKICYINREEDDGDEGLRTSKLSYHPIALLEKYTVEL